MEWEAKLWGSVCHLWHSPDQAVSLLKTEAGKCCSHHHHAQRANFFLVTSGRVIVETFTPTGHLAKVVALETGQSVTVPSMIPHRFRVHEAGTMIEVYWPDRGGVVSRDDIIRQDTGGDDPTALDPRLWLDALRSWPVPTVDPDAERMAELAIRDAMRQGTGGHAGG